jgi:ArsR family transcriptional regulator, arsenate/arsenite/antimonite-responsive transcriptional repressor
MKGASMKDFVQVMKALSDPNRVRIVKLLEHRTMCVCELQALLQVAQPTVSKHLKILEHSGLVASFKEGLWVNYQLADGGSSAYAATLLGNLRHWLTDDDDLAQLVEKLPGVRREDLCRR